MVSIIAEIGLNHLGFEKTAYRMLDKLLKTSVDVITFQIREQTYYDQSDTWRNPLSNNFYEAAIKLSHDHNKLIGFAVAEPSMIAFLNTSGADFWKTLSWDLLNDDLHSLLQKTGKKTFVSTGISSIDDIITASNKLENINFIHTQLSHQLEDVNLLAIESIRNITRKDVAFGLHCLDPKVMYVSLGLRPSSIFFYVKENLQEKYPDDEHAILLDDVDEIASNLKRLSVCMGSGTKQKIAKAEWGTV